ncbi:MAG TPA: FAD-dependent monooxygenase [Pseudolabrys sp.]|nr:FAD-dependent monooxygenase [Pseudolabrys sp.]
MARAMIIGGSLGGLFAGLLLRQAGWEVTVFEKSTGDLASRGVGIGTHVEMFEIMRRLGIVVDESIGQSFSSRFCLARDGSVIARLPFDKILTSWTLLYRALRRRLPDACYRAGMQLEDVAQQAGGVTAVFADGARADGELLVGADGVYSTVRARAFPAAPAPVYAGYVGWRGVIDENAVPQDARGELFESYAFFLPPREMFLSYLQPGADDDLTPGRRRMNWLWYHPVNATALREMCTDARGRHHAAIPPPLIRAEVIALFREQAHAILPPQFIALTEATPNPFFQPIFDLVSPSVVAGRALLLGDAAFVARPHVGAGVTKAALNAAWLTDALAASADIDAALAVYEAKTRAFGTALVARARYLGAYLEDPPRAGLKADPVTLMQAIGVPLRDIPEVAATLQ